MSEPKMGEIPWSEVDVLVKSSPQYQELLAQVAALTELLRAAEWADNSDGEYYARCPWCKHGKHEGHYAGGEDGIYSSNYHNHQGIPCPALPFLTREPSSVKQQPSQGKPEDKADGGG